MAVKCSPIVFKDIIIFGQLAYKCLRLKIILGQNEMTDLHRRKIPLFEHMIVNRL